VERTKHASCWGRQELNPCRPDQIGRDTAFALSQLGKGAVLTYQYYADNWITEKISWLLNGTLSIPQNYPNI
jgi:hypothetical protein